MLRRIFQSKHGNSLARWCKSVIDRNSRHKPSKKRDKTVLREDHPYFLIHRAKDQLQAEDSTAPRRRLKMIVEYDGTNYVGWQAQLNPKVKSVQEAIETTLLRTFYTPVIVKAASRTDRGVHAYGQVASIDLTETALKKFRNVSDHMRAILNHNLPGDIVIRDLVEVDMSFEVQKAKMKMYQYKLNVNNVRHAIAGRHVWNVKEQVNIELMKLAAKDFVGTHDFTSFTSPSTIEGKSAVRTIVRSEVFEKDGLVYFEVEGPGFLYKMVRNMVGTLVDIGRGHQPPDSIPKTLLLKNRQYAGQTAPPQGLYLSWVAY